ncbi:hypothetical protein [Bradyrhizobium sp.]|uniref:hypothetical protein n=1 Tax=Bradyrhizobium sp. TaxID=376 RepID=UPI001DB5E612|nr:hypothetical protein [Bradyrhizobium sp.]MBV8701698.1 hypothetical protein [Bradyrhizobium sp.]MBV8922913.1 hypothetical protein [Bradyrhizobium sp.]
MKKDSKTLNPDDFPVKAEDDKLKTSKGKKIADADSEKLAENIADRLNHHAYDEEQDRWSA